MDKDFSTGLCLRWKKTIKKIKIDECEKYYQCLFFSDNINTSILCVNVINHHDSFQNKGKDKVNLLLQKKQIAFNSEKADNEFNKNNKKLGI